MAKRKKRVSLGYLRKDLHRAKQRGITMTIFRHPIYGLPYSGSMSTKKPWRGSMSLRDPEEKRYTRPDLLTTLRHEIGHTSRTRRDKQRMGSYEAHEGIAWRRAIAASPTGRLGTKAWREIAAVIPGREPVLRRYARMVRSRRRKKA